MQSSIPSLLKALYVALCCGGSIAVLTVLVAVSRRSSVSRTWDPLVPVVSGTLTKKYMTALLHGTYSGHAVYATLITGGAENADTFHIQMTTTARGADWSVQYGCEKLFGKDQWYIKTEDEALQQQLSRAGILEGMQRWETHPTIRYQKNTGKLFYDEDGSVPSPERFRAQLDLLLHMAKLNEELNTTY